MLKTFSDILLRRRKKKCGPSKYFIGSFEINLPKDHALPSYQARNPLYDRLPLVVGRQIVSGWIVDLGANVGDTAAAFASGPPKKILCIEPCEPFLHFLRINTQELERSGTTVAISPLAVSQTEEHIQLSATSSTARPSITAGQFEVPSATLDRIIKHHCEDEKISLIKCDVDGFDGEALLSGEETIRMWRPTLYFECDASTRTQISSFVELLRILKDLGYKILCFDNFGRLLFNDIEIEPFQDILTYTAELKGSKFTPTFYYIDCLAYVPGNDLAERIIIDYKDLVEAAR